MNKIIAIDGSAGSGKTSISKIFAKTIGFFYLETGLIYRSLTHYFLSNKFSLRDPAKIADEFPKIKLDLSDEGKVIINGEEIDDDELRKGQVNDQVALYAQIPEIRHFARSIQKTLASQRNTVVDGRDIGSVVFPDAFCKFYLEAKTEVRAKRRQEQLAQKGIEKSIEEISREIIKRDYYDRTRNQSPLKVSPDAYLIDTSNISFDDVLNKMVSHYNKHVDLIEGLGSGSNEMLKAINDNQSETLLDSYSKARVVEVGKEIILDIGEKVDAYIDEKEVIELGDNLPEVGDNIDVFHLGRSSRGVHVSKLKADNEQTRISLSKDFANQTLVKGIVKRVIKGGFIISINGIETFCPYSEYDVVNVNTEKQVGVESDYQILELTSRNIIVSRKRPLEKVLNANREEFYSKLNVGDTITVEVIKLFDYGVLTKLTEGINILIRNRDLSWNYIKNPNEKFSVGQSFDVKITNIQDDPKFPNRKRIDASKRDLETDPFEIYVATHDQGEVVEGEVKRLEPFGAFVEISEGIDGLLRVSDLSWLHRVEHPKEVVKVGEKLQLKIVSINKHERKIGLGLKQIQPNPWDMMDQHFPVGTFVRFKITSIIQNGIYGYFQDQDQKIESFIHVNDTTFSGDGNLEEHYEVGQEISARVYAVNKKKQRVELEVKEQTGDPWVDFSQHFKVGDVVKGEVTELVENGANVKVGEDVIGFVHVSQISDKADPILEEEVKIGESYNFIIQLISPETKNLKLSIREFLMNQKNDVKNIMNQDTNTKIKISDLLN